MCPIKSSLKIFAILFICFFVAQIAFAQKQNIYFFKNNGTEVRTRDSADYIRMVSDPNSDSDLYDIKEYYLNGMPKLIGKSSQMKYNDFDGDIILFFPSGKKKETATYKNGNVTGNIYDYYPNGKLYTVKQLLSASKFSNDPSDNIYAIQTCNDSTGKALVVNGNGHYIGFDDGFNIIRSEGEIVKKLKNGVWKGSFPVGHMRVKIKKTENDSVAYTESYKNGQLISGTSTDGTGKVYAYTQIEVLPTFVGGQQAFSKFFQQNIKYPKLAKENDIQGVVYINFIIEKDGRLTEIEVVSSPGSGLGEEGVRVMLLSPQWTPGYLYGRSIRVPFTLPLNFSLASRYVLPQY